MDNFEELIEKAKMLMMGGTFEQKRRGEELLQQVIQEASGTRWAQVATDILTNGDKQSRAIYKDPELLKYSRQWSEIQELTDPRLVPLLDELKNRPHIAARLRPQVVKDISKWVAQTVPKVAGGMMERQLRAIRRFVEAVSTIEAYDVDEIKHLRKALFSVHFRDVSQQIYSVLSNWSIDEAWELFGGLSNSPSGFQEEVNQLQERIYKAASFRKSVVELLQHPMKQEPQKWLETHVLIGSLQKLCEFINDPQIPESWRQRLKDKAEKGLDAAEGFLKKEAASTTTLDDLESFWVEYGRITALNHNGRLDLKEDWCENCLNYMVSVERTNVAQARTPEELKEIGANLAAKQDRVPPFAAKRLESLADEISRIAKSWHAMQSGCDFLDPAPEEASLPTPERLRADAPRFRRILDRVREAASRMSGDDSFLSEEVFKQAAEVAEEILTQVADHTLAKELKNNAGRRALHYRLDKALALWDVEEFLRLSKDAVEDKYKDLSRYAEELRQLSALARQRGFTGWRAAAGWWREWRAANKKLSQSVREPLPDSFKKAVQSQESARADQWYVLLDDLRNVPLPAEECEEAARALGAELEALNLQGYHNALVRKAQVAFVLRYIESRQFDRAVQELEKLDPDHTDTAPLRTRLMVEQADDTGISALADVLRNEWNSVAAAMLNANAFLLKAVQRAWEEGDTNALEKLKEVISRVLSSERAASEDSNDLRQWQDWLRTEDAIKSGVSLLSVNQLITYLKVADVNERTLHKRLKSLVSHWRAENNIKMLAWAYQAFTRIDPSIMPAACDPIEDMIRRGELLADRVVGLLETEGDLRLDDLKVFHEEIKFEEKEWNCLNDFLDSLHHPVARGKKARKFSNAKERLDDLIDVLIKLDHLRQADLRKEVNRDQLDSIAACLMRQFNGLPIQKRLLDQVRRLTLLTELYSLGERIKEAAGKCGSDSPWHVFNPELFGELSKAIRNLIDRFGDADAEGGAMWAIVSDEYCNLVFQEAAILLPALYPPDLRLLADCTDSLQDEDARFSGILEQLSADQPPVPIGGGFDAERHRDYLGRFPVKPPGSKKAYRRFHLFASAEVMNTILQQSRTFLPDWVCKYLDEGVP